MVAALAFWLLAAITVMGALAVLFFRDLFRAAMGLVFSFLGVAGLYVLLSADFLAAAQVLIYAGAIAVLIVFGIMLTREVQRGNPSNRMAIPALIASALLFVAMAFVITTTRWAISPAAPTEPTTDALAAALFTTYVLPFELASVLLLVAIIGAIVLVRE